MSATGLFVGLRPPRTAPHAEPLTGLAPIAFAHEDSLYSGPRTSIDGAPIKTSYEWTLDAIDRAEALLIEKEEEATRRQRNPLIWVDRSLRTVLGLPGYLISVLLGFDPRDLSASKARALWWLSVAADAAGIYGLGVGLGWW